MGRTAVNEDKKKNGDLKVILGCLVLIVLMFFAVKLIFVFLGEAIPQKGIEPAAGQGTSASQSETLPAPRYCPHCGQGLPESFQWGQFCPYCGEEVSS